MQAKKNLRKSARKESALICERKEEHFTQIIAEKEISGNQRKINQR